MKLQFKDIELGEFFKEDHEFVVEVFHLDFPVIIVGVK